MQLAEYRNIFNHESTHFFYQANYSLILLLIQKYFPDRRDLQILDAGCGTGMLAQKMSGFGKVTGIDLSPEAVKFSRKRKVKVIRASINKLPFPAKKFDLVVSLDVLCQIGVNDRTALKEIFRVLKPGGVFIFRVPANQFLFSAHDRFVHTRQRYSKAELRQKVLDAGFDLQKISFMNMSLFFPALASSWLNKLKDSSHAESKISEVPAILNSVLLRVLKVENAWLKVSTLPFGNGLLVIARKSA